MSTDHKKITIVSNFSKLCHVKREYLVNFYISLEIRKQLQYLCNSMTNLLNMWHDGAERVSLAYRRSAILGFRKLSFNSQWSESPRGIPTQEDRRRGVEGKLCYRAIEQDARHLVEWH